MKGIMSSFISRFGFFSFPTQNELFICVTLTGLPISVIPKGIGYLEKSCAYCTCQTSPCPKAALIPVTDLAVSRRRAGRVCGCRASGHLLCPQPSPAPCSLSGRFPAWLGCCRGRSQKDPDDKPAWQAAQCVSLYSEVRGIKTLTCQC